MAIETDAIAPGLARPAASLRGPLAIAIACFVVWGLAYGLLDVLNKHFQETLHVGKAQSTWLQMAYFGAYLIMSVPAGYLLQARGYKFGIVFGLVVTAGGALLFIPSAQAASFTFFVGSMFVLAAGLCFLETAADTYVNALGPADKAPQRLNLAQSFNALGVFCGPVIGGALFFAEAPPAPGTDAGGMGAVQVTYLGIAIAVLAFAAFVALSRLPEIREADHGAAASADGGAGLWSRGHFRLGVLTQALYIGAQVGIGAFFINLVTETWPGLTSKGGAYLLSIATAGYLIGRFVATGLLSRVSPRVLLTLYGLINVALCLVVAAGLERVSAVALIAVFFFMSTMFATIFTLGVADLGPATKRGASMMVMAIGGGVLLPYPMGRIAEAFGTPAAFLLPAACFALVAFYGWRGAQPRPAAA
ncbi:MAG: sugar MFS transporter [Alphaproteobacteria bacterium]|nr:sugar MFS transporter [Alphaproteobacteria bacterium]MBU1516755.1 sugar MFS transporter [Alphaproteobacteria bacterium]MBU2092449.1 sugar MFS transporter [Alphaproteobacteria bacterium]MBU2152697.1 sugar MFS transporter [Alphaproteobacteria bacterium]MBU2305631.1 sugar MFS transporter [Alphaproteobacteria bacterium]